MRTKLFFLLLLLSLALTLDASAQGSKPLTYTDATNVAPGPESMQNAFDGKMTTYWLTYISDEEEYDPLDDPNGAFTVNRPVHIKGYTLTSGDYAGTIPKSWKLYGSADGGQTWKLVHEVKNDTQLRDNPLSPIYFPLKTTYPVAFDRYAFVFTENHYEGEWSSSEIEIYEFSLDPQACDAKGHQGELVHHDPSQPSCASLGYSEVCYECMNCGGFYKDKNGLRTLSSSPVLLSKGHSFDSGNCTRCGLTDARYAVVPASGVLVSIVDPDPAYEAVAWDLAVNTDGTYYLRSSSKRPDLSIDPEKTSVSVSNESDITLKLSSPTPFTLSFKYNENNAGAWTYTRVNGREIYRYSDDEKQNGKLFEASYTAGEHEVTLSYYKSISKYDENANITFTEEELDDYVATCLKLWDFKAVAECNHNGYNQTFVKSVQGTCANVAHDVFRCENCGEEYDVKTGESYAFNHSSALEHHVACEATCSDYGFSTDCWFCPDCLSTYSDQQGQSQLPYNTLIDPLGHNYTADMHCARCHQIQDARIEVLDLSGVTAFFTDENLEYPFTCRPKDQTGDSYTLVDNYGETRVFPANALVSSNPEITNGVSTFTVSSDKDFRVKFKYNMVTNSDYYAYDPINLNVSIGTAFGINRHPWWYDDKKVGSPEEFSIDLKAGTYTVTMNMNRYGAEAEGYGYLDHPAGGDDYGYIYDFVACTHQPADIVYTREQPATCISVSETDMRCNRCGYEVTLYGTEKDMNHHTPGLAETLAQEPTCTEMGVSQTYYSCSDCKQLYADAEGTQLLDEKPLVAALGHQYDAEGNCSQCQGGETYDGTPATPHLLTVGDCDRYSLPATYAGYYAITSAAELYGFAALVNTDGKTDIKAVLTQDILVNRNIVRDRSEWCSLNENFEYENGFESPRVNVKDKQMWTPIGQTGDTSFKGVFDGNGHTISGLFYSCASKVMAACKGTAKYFYFNNYTPSDYVGLFGQLNEAKVRNVKLKDCYFFGDKELGGIAGYAKHSVIDGCEVQGYINGIPSYVNGSRSIMLGGIVGNMGGSTIVSQCQTDCVVEGCFNIGGLVGQMVNSHLVNSIAYGTVTTTYGYDEEYQPSVGLLVGLNDGFSDYSSIFNCFTTQNVTGEKDNRIVGDGAWRLEKSDNYKQVTAEELKSGWVANQFAKSFELPDYNSEWEYGEYPWGYGWHNSVWTVAEGDLWGQTLGLDDVPSLDASKPRVYYGVTSCTDETNIYSNYEILSSGHEFNSNGICLKTEGEVHYQPCETDKEGVYLINNYGNLCAFADMVNDGQTDISGRLTTDIVANKDLLDAEGNLSASYADAETLIADGTLLTWTPIGLEGFNGQLDGGCHTISGLYCNRKDNYASLVGVLDCGTVSDLNLTGSYLRSNNYAGAFAGWSKQGILLNCSSSRVNLSTVVNSGNVYCGGLVACLDGTISHCLNLGGALYDKTGNDKQDQIITSFYLSDKGGENTCTKEQLASGEITYKLNGGVTHVDNRWGQTLQYDAVPLLADTCQLVYYGYADCRNSTLLSYTNTECSADIPGHHYREGTCVFCGGFQPAGLNKGWYEVHNYGQLMWFAQEANAKSDKDHLYCMKLTGNVAVNRDVLDESNQLNGIPHRKWTPIGSPEHPFFGSIDGQGHSISGLYCEGDKYVGLVGYMDCDKDTICHLTLTDSYFELTGTDKESKYVGAFVGMAKKGATLYNCSASGVVSAPSGAAVGGLAGLVEGTLLMNCNSHMRVDGYAWVGGVVGKADKASELLYCMNTESVTAQGTSLGGIVGVLSDTSSIRVSYNTGDVTNTTSVKKAKCYTGGVVGLMDATKNLVSSCYNLGNVKSANGVYVGGIVGQLTNGLKAEVSPTLQCCYNPMPVTAYTKNGAGGIYGFRGANCGVYFCYQDIAKFSETSEGVTALTAFQFGGGELCSMLNSNASALDNASVNKVPRRTYAQAPRRAPRRVGESTTDEDIDDTIVAEETIGENVSTEVLWRQRVGVDDYPTFSGPRVFYNKKTDEYICLEDGDVNADTKIDLEDAESVNNILLKRESDDFGTADVNGDGKVTILDLILQIEKLK